MRKMYEFTQEVTKLSRNQIIFSSLRYICNRYFSNLNLKKAWRSIYTCYFFNNNQYQVTELFGDKILGFLTLSWILKKNKAKSVGDLTKESSYLTRNTTLFSIYKLITSWDTKVGIKFAYETIEVLIACLYLYNGIDSAYNFINEFFPLFYENSVFYSRHNPKSILIETIIKHNKTTPIFINKQVINPDNTSKFFCCVYFKYMSKKYWIYAYSRNIRESEDLACIRANLIIKTSRYLH